jgi:PAS domain S-box-containing protein
MPAVALLYRKDGRHAYDLPMTEQERTFAANQRLIATTGLNSKITYCNDAFVAISGFTYDELVGQPHSLVRHPGLPPGSKAMSPKTSTSRTPA